MSELSRLAANPWKRSSGVCACCGRTSHTVWGDILDANRTAAIYFVQWTESSPDHSPSIDLVLGPWGDGTGPNDRELVSLLFRPAHDGGSFMVIDAQERQIARQSVCSRGLGREEVVGTPIANSVFALVDAIWETDPRIAEVKALNGAA